MATHTATYPCVCCGGTNCWQCAGSPPATIDVTLAGLTSCFPVDDGAGTITSLENVTPGFPNDTVTLLPSDYDPCLYIKVRPHVADLVFRDYMGVETGRVPLDASYFLSFNGDGTAEFIVNLRDGVFADNINGTVTVTWVCGTGFTAANGNLAGNCYPGLNDYWDGNATGS